MKKQVFLLTIFFVLSNSNLFSQNENKVYVDSSGILRWSCNNDDVALFGVNYDVPFAYSYRTIKRMGLSHKEAIDIDVAQFKRLGLDAYRIHIWDREISDKSGNLLVNEHLDLLDYLIHKLKENNIYIILTPIAWWGPGWPEPDPVTEGFSNYYSKVELVTKPEAREAQKNYLKQILNHVNKYDNVNYKEDSDIIAFEIINEPGHPDDITMTTGYINELTDVFRNEGVTKPIYYNISQNWSKEQAAAVYNANINGISFQWYPTGLVKNAPLQGNFLPHVNHYPVPEIEDENFRNKTRMVYEFDAADVGESVMYPAMARSFREAGMQWATMFAYDPTFFAATNTDYNTHFLNLFYTPRKAISLMIAAEVFRNTEPYQKFGSYPDNLEFGDFKIDFESELSQFNSDTKFYYSNNTNSAPKNPELLQHIAGTGSSAIITYEGTGTYFLDKLAGNIWRLELLPDAAWEENPFGRNSPDKFVAGLFYAPSKMKINLPGFGSEFYVFEEENTFNSKNGEVEIFPGKYLISTEKLSNDYLEKYLKFYEGVKAGGLNGQEIIVRNKIPHSLMSDKTEQLYFEIYSENNISNAAVYVRIPGWRSMMEIPAEKLGKYLYKIDFDTKRFINSELEYCISFKTDGKDLTYPTRLPKNPNAWDYYGEDFYKLKILSEYSDMILFNPESDTKNISFEDVWREVEFSAGKYFSENGDEHYAVNFNKVKEPIEKLTFQIELDKSFGKTAVSGYNYLKIRCSASTKKIDSVYINMVDENMTGYGTTIAVGASDDEIIVPLKELVKDKWILLPRPYPHFLPYYFDRTEDTSDKEISGIVFVQVTLPLNKLQPGDSTTRFLLSRISLSK